MQSILFLVITNYLKNNRYFDRSIDTLHHFTCCYIFYIQCTYTSKLHFFFKRAHYFLRVLFPQSLNQHFCMHYLVLQSYEGNKKSISFILNPPYTTQDMNMFSYFQARNIERQGTIKSDNARMVIHTYPFLHLYPIIH